MGLYREEAQQAFADRWVGEVDPDPTNGLKKLVAFLIAIVCFVVFALAFVQFPLVSIERGTLFVSQHRYEIPVQPGYSVDSVFVSPGQLVRSGDPIFKLKDPSRSMASDRQLKIMSQLHEMKDEVREYIQASSSRVSRLRSQLQNEQVLIEQQIQFTKESIASMVEAIEISQESQSASIKAQKIGLLSIINVNATRLAHVELQSDLVKSQAELAALEREKAGIEQRFMEMLEREAISRLDYGQMLSGLLMSEMDQIRAAHQTVLTPISGHVAQVSVFPGEWVAGPRVGATVLSNDRSVSARLMVSADVVTSIKVGDVVRTRIDALNYKQYGILEGKVSGVSASTSDSGAGEVTPDSGSGGRYMIAIEIPESQQNMNLLSHVIDGMGVSVPVERRRDTLIGHLLSGS